LLKLSRWNTIDKIIISFIFFCSSLLMADLPKLTIRGALHMLRLFLLSDKFFLIFLTFPFCCLQIHFACKTHHNDFSKTQCGNECYMLSGHMHCFLISRTIHMYIISLCTYKLPYGYLWTLSIKVHRMIVHM